MAYDNNEPNDNVKIRLLPQNTRNNFQAIQSADTTFSPDGLNLGQQAGNLAALASNLRLFSKSDGSTSQLFSIDPTGVVSQLTGNVNATAAAGHIILLGTILLNWGEVTLSAGGSATATFDKAYAAADYYLFALTRGASLGAAKVVYVRVNSASATISGPGNQVISYFTIGIA